jgi:murein L,D-transpeptidase YafK
MIALMIAPLESNGAGLPSSARSQKAIARQKLVLNRALSDKKMPWGAPIYLRIFKTEKRLEVWLKQGRRFRLFKCYRICTYGAKGVGPKTRQGDGRAPEGFYRVRPEQMNPFSRFHLAINLGYPNAFDRHHGYSGSALMVHGGCVSIGCFAMTDENMEEIYALAHAALSGGQPYFMVHIFPFEMTPRNLNRHRHSKWFDFWCNLKEGYDRFQESNGLPPDVEVKNGQYYIRGIAGESGRWAVILSGIPVRGSVGIVSAWAADR